MERRVTLPVVNVVGLVAVTKEHQRMGQDKLTFDASDLKKLGRTEWYLQSNRVNQHLWNIFTSVIFKTESWYVCAWFTNEKQDNSCDRLFVVSLSL